MSKSIDRDLSALKGARKALLKSSSRRMLKANLDFLVDYFWYHPSSEIPECLRSNKACTRLETGDRELDKILNPAVSSG